MRIERRRCAIGVLIVAAVQACGGLSVSPAGPTPIKESVRGGDPTLLNIEGTLDDGGSFTGYMVFGSKDLETRSEFGRYQALYWDVVVKGGTATRDARFTHANSGRALVEAYNSPYPAIGLTFLWPDADPELQRLTPHFRAPDVYNADQPPASADFGDLIPGTDADSFDVYVDGQGGVAHIVSARIFAEPALPVDRS